MVKKDSARLKASVEALIEVGLLQGHGTGRGRSYTLSAHLYELHGKRVEYTRQVGFDRLQSEQLVKNFVKQHGSITRSDVMALCHMSPNQAYKLLKKLVDGKFIVKQGDRKSACYIAGDL